MVLDGCVGVDALILVSTRKETGETESFGVVQRRDLTSRTKREGHISYLNNHLQARLHTRTLKNSIKPTPLPRPALHLRIICREHRLRRRLPRNSQLLLDTRPELPRDQKLPIRKLVIDCEVDAAFVDVRDDDVLRARHAQHGGCKAPDGAGNKHERRATWGEAGAAHSVDGDAEGLEEGGDGEGDGGGKSSGERVLI